jgi:hypothetical protein
MGTLLTCLPRLTLAQLRPTLRSTPVCMCRRDLQTSHRPHGKIADALASTLACTTAADALVNYSLMYVPQIRPVNSPLPQWESLADMFNLTLPFQLGGIHLLFILGICTCLQNPIVLMFKSSHGPDGNTADVLASTHACTTAADTLVNYSLMYVPQRPVISHRPDGKIADMLAPTLACTTANALVNDRGYVPQRPCKVPIAPMGNSQLLVVCRAVVSIFILAVSR